METRELTRPLLIAQDNSPEKRLRRLSGLVLPVPRATRTTTSSDGVRISVTMNMSSLTLTTLSGSLLRAPPLRLARPSPAEKTTVL